MEGHKFRRQEPIGKYIVDFVCHEKRIVVEVDGGQHSTDKTRDNERDKWFEEQGYKVLRFWNNEVLTNIDSVLEVIRGNCLNHPPLNPLLLKIPLSSVLPRQRGEDMVGAREGR